MAAETPRRSERASEHVGCAFVEAWDCSAAPKPRSVAERLSDYLGLRPDQSREILRHRCGCESEDDHQTGNPDCAVGLLVETILEKAGPR